MSVQLRKESGEPRGQRVPWCGHRANLYPMLRALTLPTAKNPKLEVTNFLQPPETLNLVKQCRWRPWENRSTGGKGKEISNAGVLCGRGTGKKITKVALEVNLL